jgi:CysZ protein
MIRSKIKRFKQTFNENDTLLLKTLGVFIEAHEFVKKNNLRKYLLISGFFFLLLFTLTIKLILYFVNTVEAPVSNKILAVLNEYLSLNSKDILTGIKVFFWLVKKGIESNKDAIFSTIFLIIGTPFFSFISSKTEEAYNGVKYPFQWRIFLKEIKRGLLLSIRNSLKQFVLFFLVLLLSFIPVISIFTPLLMFVIQAYYNGILMTDYTLERHGKTLKESQVFYASHKTQMFAIGLGFMFLLLVPVVGWFIAPTYSLVASFLIYSKVNK